MEMERISMLSHIPGKAMARNVKLVEILKELQSINTNPQYRIHLGQSDLEVRIKNHLKYDWRPYIKVDIKTLDPNNTILKWDLTGDIAKMITSAIVHLSKKNKRLASKSPEGHPSRKKRGNISNLHISEFLLDFKEGTQMVPLYSENNLLEDGSEDEDTTLKESSTAMEDDSSHTATKIPDAVSSHREESLDDSVSEDLK